MKSKLALVDMNGAFKLLQLMSLLFFLGIIFGWKLHYADYLFPLLLFFGAHAGEVEVVQEGLSINNLESSQDVVVLKKRYIRNNKNLHQKIFIICRLVAYFFFLLVLTRDILEGLKIIPAL